jgi:hypothetical protein
MGTRPQGNLLVWVISGAVGLLVVAGALLLVKPIPRRQPPKAKTGGGLGVQPLQGNRLLAEQAALRDPMTLFLPVTRANRATTPQADASEVDLGLELARSFPGKLAYADESASVEFPLRTPAPSRPVDVIGLGDPELPFLGMGRKDRAVTALPARSAYIEVKAADTGTTVMTEAVPNAKVPSANDWQPLEMLAVIDRIGLVAPPTVCRTSNDDNVDGFFRTFLEKGFHLGERLGPGSYVVTIGR